MDRIIIATTELSREIWSTIYRFVRSIAHNEDIKSKKKAFHEINECASICLNTVLSEKKATDVYTLYGEEIGDNQLGFLSPFTCFSILYQKLTDEEDFAELVPFVLFQHEFGDSVSLGIDITNLKTQSYRFKCSDFFILFDETKPRLGKRNIYFINTNGIRVVDKETGEVRIVRTMSFAGKGASIQKKYEGKPSRRFLPLIPITKDNYKSIFGLEQESSSKELAFVNKSIEIIRKELDKRISFSEGSPFDRWLKVGYYYSYSPKELKRKGDREINNIRNIIQLYANSIFELIQNIIFHGGGEGLIYCVFDKKINISNSYQECIPGFADYDDDMRFLRVGICDFNKLGIVDTYTSKTINADGAIESEDISLLNFFDINSIATTGLSKLEMRYAARLGIKTFVKTIINNKGYFRVESNKKIDNYTIKEAFHTITNNNLVQLGVPENYYYLNGTHYEVVVPLIGIDNNVFPLQMGKTNVFRNDSPIYPPIIAQPFLVSDLLDIHNSLDKDSQVANIKRISDNILRQWTDSCNEKLENIIALDMIGQTTEKDASVIFKIVSCLQLSKCDGFEKVILSNVTDELSNELFRLIDTLILDNGSDEIWSRNSAIIIISENLQIRIIWGKTKSELDYINQKVHNYKNFFAQTSNQVQKSTIEITDETKKKAKEFIAPYDFMVFSPNNVSLFEGFVLRCLEKEIISNDIVGFLANHANTYIGNKIIVKNYYEADMLFQNGFFAEKFALLIAQNIQSILQTEKHKKILLIGYKQYSEFLLKRVSVELQKQFEEVSCVIASGEKDILTDSTYPNENDEKENYGREVDKTSAYRTKDILNTEILFNFNIGNSEKNIEDYILHNIDNYRIITIVPIGSTLSTNDKIIAGFKQWYKRKNEEKKTNDKINNLEELANNPFVYNHCVIVVRNEVGATVTKMEEEQSWQNVDISNHLIETQFQNAKKIYYTIQIAKTKKDNDNDSNWEKRLNDNISFPPNWKDEEYVNYTENSSINSQNLMGFPQAVPLESIDYNEELSRLYEFKNDIYKGHIDAGGCHHKYYIDTESFVNRRTNSFQKWLIELRKDFCFDKLNVLITPNAEYESDFISLVNEKVFDGKALVVYLDVKNWRNNIVHKLSFLNRIPQSNVRFHYIDHALLTGATFQETRSYLFSIMDYKDVQFESIITIVNRLSFAKYKEIVSIIKKDDRLLSYVCLHYPSNEGEQECELCKLDRYYKVLKNKTVLDSCQKVIWENQVKLKLIPKFRIRNNPNRKKEDNIHNKRNFLRLLMTHEIYHEISQSVDSLSDDKKKNWDECRKKVTRNLDDLYKKLCNISQHENASPFIQCIDKCYQGDVFLDAADLRSFFEKKKIVDKKIAFLKVISSPPLSQYIVIREYAYRLLLDELHSIINKTSTLGDDITYDDLKIAKAIMKSLSFLKSNALVRKDVIVGVWNVLRWVVENHDREYTELNEFKERLSQQELKLNQKLQTLKQEKNKIDDSKIENGQKVLNFDESQNEIIDEHTEDDIKEIESTINSIIKYREELESEQVYRLSNKEIIKDFSRDIQFFIKNSIVEDDAKATFLGELLRRGSEMTDFDNYRISKTSLYLGKSESDDKNELFHHFEDVRDKDFGSEYIYFLVWLFYDNTTIIRKTFEHFKKELKKDDSIHNLFYPDNKSVNELIDIKDFRDNISNVKKDFSRKVRNEYYYHSFRPYLTNGDNVDYVKKLLYVTYAKLKLDDLISKKTYIESDTRVLLEIFAAIMDADAAFLTMKKKSEYSSERNEYQLYPISIYSTVEKVKDNGWDHDRWMLIDNYYTGLVYTYNNIKFPIITKCNIENNDDKESCVEYYGENMDLNAHSLCVFVIQDKVDLNNSENEKPSLVATITFLYQKDNPINLNEKDFRIHLQESGRLLLLLKNNINNYVIDYLVREKVFDLWEQNFWSIRRFEKVYSNSNHVFNSVFDQLEEFETLKLDLFEGNYKNMKLVEDMIVLSLGKTWYWLTDEMISYLYANIERHKINGKHYLDLDEKDDATLRKKHSTIDVFSELFVKMLRVQLQLRWVGQKIVINGVDINDSDSYSKIKIEESELHCNKGIIQTFIVQCLNNSLRDNNENGGHRYCDTKKVIITVDKKTITIKDVVVLGSKPPQKTVHLFEKNKKMIKDMNCDRYSCTTLTSLQGFVNYMREQKDSYSYDCYFEYDKNNDFEVKITFN